MITRTSTLSILGCAFLLLNACKKDKEDLPPDAVNESEVITTLRLTFVAPGDTVVLSFEDLDGAGGAPPVISSDTFSLNTDYTCALLLLNASSTPVDTVSNEVAMEAEDHQFFFSSTDNSLVWQSYADADANGMPVGLFSMWSTGAQSGSGSVGVVLRHMPDKSGAGVSTGDLTNAGGDTDIEVDIPYVVL